MNAGLGPKMNSSMDTTYFRQILFKKTGAECIKNEM